MFPTPDDIEPRGGLGSKGWAFLWLIRFVPSTTAGLAVVAGLRLSANPRATSMAGLAFGSVFSMTSACSAWNDYMDQVTDEINVPYRPLPSAILSTKVALSYTAIAYVSGAFLASGLGVKGIMFYVPAAILSLAYSPLIKRVVGVKDLFVGLFCGGILIFGAYIGGNMSRATIPAVILVTSVASRELLIDIHDIEGDRVGGYTTVPIVFGASRTRLIVALLLSVTSFLELWLLTRIVIGFIPKLTLIASAACFLYVAVVSGRRHNVSAHKLIGEIRVLMFGLLLGVTSLLI